MKKTFAILCISALGFASVRAQTPGAAPAATPAGEQPEVRSAYVLSLKDFGSEDIAYLSLPQTAPEVAVVVLPGLAGLNKETKLKCDYLASRGFIVLALDLFNGQIPRDQADALRMQAEVRKDSASKTIDAGRRFFAESPRFKTEKAVLMGWTANASLALHVSNSTKDLSGVILVEPWLKKGEKIEYPKIPTMVVCSANDPAGMWLMSDLKTQGQGRLLTEVPVAANPGFLIADGSENTRSDIWSGIIGFIKHCAQSSPAEKSLIDKIF